MKRTLLPLLIILFFAGEANAQFSRYIIRLKDKGSNPFSINNPGQFLTQRAIERRLRYNILIDSTDLPVTPRYIDSLRAAGAVSILNTSKWLNQVLIKTSDAAALAKINSFPFVLASVPLAPLAPSPQTIPYKLGTYESAVSSFLPAEQESLVDVYNYGRSNGQVKIHQGEFLHNHGFRGEGMQLAVMDAGFQNYLTLRPFDSIRRNNQILGTWDFVTNETSVNEDNAHGMQCLSLIAANVPGVFVGTAPKTSFYLYRTEDVASEYPVEEQNYAAGLERADSLGVDITSTSLGYFRFDNPIFNYTYNDLNGNTTISARAADMGAKKGMIMVVANGNEGANSWRFLLSPADGDSVFAVGAVDTLGNVAPFSGYGPSSDGQVKPNVASVGWRAMVANPADGSPVPGNGTSFACPNLAGIVSCLWQAYPEVNNMGIMGALQQSATRATNPDDRVGYGIPDAKKAFVILLKQLSTKQSNINNCNATIALRLKADTSITVTLERKQPGELNFTSVASKKGSGTFAMQDFNFTDNIASNQTGAVQYRFKTDISTDTTFYLDSTSLVLTSACGVVNFDDEIRIAPNPVIGDAIVTINRSGGYSYEVVLQNAAGQKLAQVKSSQASGINNISLPMRRVSKGVYFITVLINNKKIISREVLKR